jgi:flagellar protein FlaI
MAAEFKKDTKAKKGKKGSTYSFLDGIEDFLPEKGSSATPEGEKVDKSQNKEETQGRDEKSAVELNLSAAPTPEKAPSGKTKVKKAKKGSYSFLEGIEEEKAADQLSNAVSKKKSASKPSSPASRTKKEGTPSEIKMGGLIGKVLSGEFKAGQVAEPDVMAGFSVLEKSTQMGKEITGTVVEKGNGYQILKTKAEKSLTYLVTIPEFTKEEKKLLIAIGKRAVAEINVDPEAIHDYAQKKKVFTEKVIELMEKEYPKIKKDTKLWFATFIVQDMIGYGILDPLLSNDDLEEVMLIATNIPVYVYHRKHGMCKTNIVFEDSGS